MQHDLSNSFVGGIFPELHIVVLKSNLIDCSIYICMMSVGNNNLVYMMVSKENVVNSASGSDTQVHSQGQFPTYTVVTTPHTRVTQMMTNVAKPGLVTDIENPMKNPSNKASIISIVKGSGNSNQQIFVRKNSNIESSNEVQMIRPRTPVENPNHHIYVRKSSSSLHDMVNESQNRNSQSDSYSQPPSYIDATQYNHREVPHSSFQVQSPYEVHRSSHTQVEKKSAKRSIHLQGDKKVHIIHDSSRSVDHQSEHKTLDSNRTAHQQEQKTVVYEAPSRSIYQLNDQKPQQKHERSIHESGRQHSEMKSQRIRDPNHSMYHEQKNQQQIHYQLADQNNQQLHESSQPLYLLNEQKGQQYEYQQNEQKTHQIHDQKGQQQVQHSDQKSQHESSRSQHNDPKGQQIHVHKVHHGNARVKYVEFKPIQQGMKYRQMMHQSPRSYNPNSMKQTLYYSNHLTNQNSPGSHHLTVQTPARSPLSPLHSPPALRPPPTVPSGTVWHSPPSLVPSPEVRPRFDFISSPQSITTAGSPIQVSQKIYAGKDGKQINISGNHNILLPRLPANYQLSSSNHHTSQNANIPRSKATFIQTSVSNTPSSQSAYDNQSNFSSSGIGSTSVATTVTVTMTYIPIPTSTKDKFVYVPVNSGQPVVLYQNQPSGKPVLLPQQVLHTGKNVSAVKDIIKDSTAFSTVRLQGLVNYGTAKNSNFTTLVTSTTNSSIKGMKYHLATTSLTQAQNHSLKKSGFFKLDQKSGAFNMDHYDLEKEKNSLTNKDFLPDLDGKRNEDVTLSADKFSNAGEVMTLINNQLRLVPPQIGISNQTSIIGSKRNNIGIPIPNNNEFMIQQPSYLHEKSFNDDLYNMNDLDDLNQKKKRGRPQQEKLPPKKGKKKDKGKIKSPTQGNLVSALSGGPQDSNQLLIDAYKKQQQVQLQKHYFDDPLLKLPDLPPTPESWTANDVHKYLLSTDCACYADAIKAEEMDGKSFLLVTREALMDFLGVKLGPALKIAGHAAGLRARQRIYCLSMQDQKSPIIPKEKKSKLTMRIIQKPPDLISSNNAERIDTPVNKPVQNSVSADLVIPHVSILLPMLEEKKPIVNTLPLVKEPSPVILKVPTLPLIMGDSCTTKIPEIVINGETPKIELVSDEKNSYCTEDILSIKDKLVIDIDKKTEPITDKVQIDVENISPNKLDLSSHHKTSPSQVQHALTENDSNGISHEGS